MKTTIFGIIATLLVLGLLPFALLARSRASQSPAAPLHLVLDMDMQSKGKAQRATPLYADGRFMLPSVGKGAAVRVRASTEDNASEWVNVASALLVVGLIIAIAIHAGLLAAAVALCATNLISAVPWTLDSSAWYFPQSALVLGALALLAAFGGFAMLSGGADAPRRAAL